MPPLTYTQAIADVERRVQKSRTSFAAGMRVLPRERREGMFAFYAFCREVDDIADDSPTAAIRDQGLALWRQKIRDLFQQGKAEDSICIALLPAISLYHLVEDDFQAIIEGMDMDARTTIFAPTMEELDTYCDHVASAVGRASVRIFGDASKPAMKVAYHLGRALQLTNILRDLAEDAAKGRLYLPREILVDHGIDLDQSAKDILNSPSLPLVCRDLAAVADEHFRQASAAMRLANSTAMKPARIMRDYYHATWQLLVKKGWKDPFQRVSLPLWQKLWLMTRGLLGSGS